jgi:hypothetical protein
MLNSVGLEPTRNYPLAVSTGVPEASAITTRPTVRVFINVIDEDVGEQLNYIR